MTEKTKIVEGNYVSATYKKGTVFPYKIFIPECTGEAYAVLVNHDGLNDAEVYAMQTLYKNGEAPNCVIIGISSGTLPSTVEGGINRGMRMDEYDVFSSEYPNFIVDEFIPYVAKTYGLKLSDSADMHAISGGSSGGISSWNTAWRRNDYFKRVYMSSPSFLSMANGRELPALIRKVETKPIRVYMEYSETEPDDYFGSSLCAATEAERALRFAGYEMRCNYYPKEGHCSRYRDHATMLQAMRWLWENHQEKITVKKLSPRMEKLISVDEPWELTNESFLEKAPAVSNGNYTSAGEYVANGDKILFRNENGEKTVADGFGEISALAFSSDKWRLYVGDLRRGCVYAMTVEKDGSLSGKYLCGALHIETDFKICGALDLCADSTDRIFVATEIGIQAIRSFGLIDVILPLPNNAIPEKIALGGENEQYLYALSNGKLFKRKLLQGGKQNEEITPNLNASYYD